MSTRSYVGYIRPDKTVAYAYNHSDSYLEGLGVVLFANDPDKVRRAIDSCDTSLLWGNGESGYESESAPYTASTSNDFLDITFKDFAIEFCYLLDEKGTWHVSSSHGVKDKVYLLSELIGENADPVLQDTFLEMYYDDVMESVRSEWNRAKPYQGLA